MTIGYEGLTIDSYINKLINNNVVFGDRRSEKSSFDEIWVQQNALPELS